VKETRCGGFFFLPIEIFTSWYVLANDSINDTIIVEIFAEGVQMQGLVIGKGVFI